MSVNVLPHLLQQISETPLTSFPYPYFYIKQIFPEPFYEELLRHLPDTSYFHPLEEYPTRLCLNLGKGLASLPFPLFLFWKQLADSLYSDELIDALLKRFESPSKRNITVDAALIRDQSNYSIGPHTDHPNKVLSLLFYLPSSLETVLKPKFLVEYSLQVWRNHAGGESTISIGSH